MEEQVFEVAVGEALQFGDHTLTVLDIDSGEITFRLDSFDDAEQEQQIQQSPATRPR